jgi:translation initiation factor IF-2
MASARRRQATGRAMGEAAPQPLTFPDAERAAFRAGHHARGVRGARRGASPAGGATRARTQRTAPAPGRPSPRPRPVLRRAGAPSPTHDRRVGARGVGPRGTAQAPAVRAAPARGPSAGADGGRASEGGRGAGTSGNGVTPGPGRAQAARVEGIFRRAPWPRRCHGSTGHRDFGRSGDGEPRATSAEEPDAGNPLVRIWRGAGMGNRPAYSTRPFPLTTSVPQPCARLAARRPQAG